jgi:hypothetical protein
VPTTYEEVRAAHLHYNTALGARRSPNARVNDFREKQTRAFISHGLATLADLEPYLRIAPAPTRDEPARLSAKIDAVAFNTAFVHTCTYVHGGPTARRSPPTLP